MKVQFATTTGEVSYDDKAVSVSSVDDPTPPSDDPSWVMVGSSITELRYSKQTILWFWRKESEG